MTHPFATICQHGVQFLNECSDCPGGAPVPIDTANAHGPSDACTLVHCHTHGVDEPGTGYIGCGECGHLYRTAAELRREYRSVWNGWLRNSVGDAPLSDQLHTIGGWLRSRFALARSISFCQHCIHDF